MLFVPKIIVACLNEETEWCQIKKIKKFENI